MVIGLKTKSKRSTSVQVDYLIHIGEIKPWPPSQSLRSLRSVLIQWENGDRSSGSTNSVVPSLGSAIGEGKIDFDECFRLPVTLLREMSVKGNADIFQKNCLEFNLYEPRREKAVKGQLLATAIIDLADYGILKETLSISVPMNCKRSFRKTDQPVLCIKIQPVDKGHTSSSTRVNLSKEVSVDKNGGESVSTLLDEEYTEESELASYTDDDVSSHSSLAVTSTSDSYGGLTSHNEENEQYTVTRDSTEGENKDHALGTKLELERSELMPQTMPHENLKGNSPFSSSVVLSSVPGNQLNGPASESEIRENVVTRSVHSSSSSINDGNTGEESNTNMRSNVDSTQKVHDTIANGQSAISDVNYKNGEQTTSNRFSEEVASLNKCAQGVEKLVSSTSCDFQVNEDGTGKDCTIDPSFPEKTAITCYSSVENVEKKTVEKRLDEEKQSTEDEVSNSFSLDATWKQITTGSDTISVTQGSQEIKENDLKSNRLKHVKSVRSPLVPVRSNGLVRSTEQMEMKEVVLGDSQKGVGSHNITERKDAKVCSKDTRSPIFDSKIQQLEHRIKMLEGELREAAAIEASLYSVVPDHGSSMNKVHTPARRLSRLYLHACRESAQPRRASAARNAVSGLVLVAKACGNDVPRLTFWFSNSVVLRAIISQGVADPELQLSAGSSLERNSAAKGNNKISLKWKESSPIKDNKSGAYGNFGDWEDPCTFVSALKKIEAWIFSRIVESIWWQTLTPLMQSAAPKAIIRGVGSGSKESYEMTHSSGDEEQGNISLELWKKAFKDACERLCPVRAGGHECGCLLILARMIMEQCVARLDVAMFNAILRESTDEIPTDPVSDPISDSKVLPIPAGITSFGAGARLKNAIGNWSRWLTDIFGMDDESPEDENDHGDTDERQEKSFKSFRLLNHLSDLMMLPKDMLLSRTIRKEVCPTFGAPLIKRVLDHFVPDEFCPDPIPDVVLKALDSVEPLDDEKSATKIPSAAAPTIYSPPSAATIAGIIGDVKNQSQLRRSTSSVLRKSYTSDDELDELNSPLASIFLDGSRISPTSKKPSWTSKQNGNQNAVRYELLRDVWTNSE